MSLDDKISFISSSKLESNLQTTYLKLLQFAAIKLKIETAPVLSDLQQIRIFFSFFQLLAATAAHPLSLI